VKDTSPRMERKFRAMVMKRSGEERLKMGCSMHATARALVKASVSEKDPVAVNGPWSKLPSLKRTRSQ